MDRLARFKDDLSALQPSQMLSKWLLTGDSFALDTDLEFKLRDQISQHFEVEYSEVVLIGSGKLGFSIAPMKRYREFGDHSDLDVAVVSEVLFSKVWKETYNYAKSGAYWPSAKVFFKYLSQGWIRPDKLPSSPTFKFSGVWWDFFNGESAKGTYGHYKLRAGLYQSWFFFNQYQVSCIQKCKSALGDK